MKDTRRTRLVLAVLLLTAFTLITLDFRSGQSGIFGSVRNVASTVFGPVERGVDSVVRPVRNWLGSLGDNTSKERDMQTRIDNLETQLRNQPFDAQRIQQVDKLLGLAGAGQYRIVPAQIIASGSGSGFEWTATIDVGQRDGITPDMTVINGDGLVGRVKYVGSTTSVVLLAIDPQSSVGVRLPDGSLGLVTGHGRGEMTFRLFDAHERVAVGAGLVTEGSVDQKPYVRGVPVGSVATAESALAGAVQSGTVRSYVDFGSLGVVGVVVQPPRTDPRSSLLPPAPTPSPTPAPTPTSPSNPTPSVTPSPTPTGGRR